jgi:SHS2 domain-containing protein
VALLNECIFQFDTYGFVARRAELKELSEGRARAVLWGEEFDPGRHPRGLLVKAATYHNLDIRKTDGLWEAEVIFDI